MPITPAPTTTIEAGSDLRSRIPSESSTRSSSNSTPDGRAGVVPVAMTMYSPLMVVVSRREGSSTAMVCGSTNRPCPISRSTRLRINWLRTTSISLPITCWVRASRSAGVIRSLTR